ncbi:MAG: hypothetical protein DMG50_21375 [Acidobacteria bacterium]|nr:MAG: hypothetical protein DMG50_21375 [Acidobacteriota bacterium]
MLTAGEGCRLTLRQLANGQPRPRTTAGTAGTFLPFLLLSCAAYSHGVPAASHLAASGHGI